MKNLFNQSMKNSRIVIVILNKVKNGEFIIVVFENASSLSLHNVTYVLFIWCTDIQNYP